ncbi:hypothetical protein [Fibrobacter sp. UWEL]|uniref:hypothetical protein n=1 Tax=Fibrobacter sp. UWEL TaxID=1896209 RepID=UPI000914BE3A|nr:hypothetical protein [Fibrobacter sp. UWEL]SHL29818.1 hypothetical protein SAMN05720468_12110 [Fibrobacter sp. UWEL]
MKKTDKQKPFLEALEEWRRDNDVTDVSIADVLNTKSKELPDAEKISKIWQ